MDVEVIHTDITTLEVDAVVNAASPRMRGGGGVDGAIHRAAGPGLLAECVERFPEGLPTGGAGWTRGHRLSARYVVHVVGPVYDGTGANRDRLVACYVNALRVADELFDEAYSMAFPLVSAGVYGWPKADAARAQVETLVSTSSRLGRAVLVGYDAATADLLTQTCSEVLSEVLSEGPSAERRPSG